MSAVLVSTAVCFGAAASLESAGTGTIVPVLELRLVDAVELFDLDLRSHFGLLSRQRLATYEVVLAFRVGLHKDSFLVEMGEVESPS